MSYINEICIADLFTSGLALHETAHEYVDQTGFLRNITLGYQLGAVFLTAFHEGLLQDLIVPNTSEYLSLKYGIPSDKLSLILGMLVSGQVLHYHDGVYRLRTELIPFLDPRSPVYAQWLESECKYRQYWADSGSFLRNSDIQNTGLLESRRYKKDEIISMGVQSLLGRLQGIVHNLKDYPRFFSSRRLLDLGGGHGLIGIACAQANSGMKVVIFDKPEVVRIAWEHVCMSGIADRIVCIGGDYLQDSIGSGYDIILHICPTDFPFNIDYQVIQIVRAALSQKGLYVRCGFFLDDNCHGPLLTTSFALAAEMRGEKRHRTIPEFGKMVYDAGLDLIKTIDLSPCCGIPMYMLMCEPNASK